MSANEKFLPTSCRQVGLRRKSAGFTPPASTSQRLNSSINIVTETQNNSLHHSEYPKSNPVVNSLSSVPLLQPAFKRRRYSAPRILATSKTKENFHSREIEPDRRFPEDELSVSNSEDTLQSDHGLDFAEIQPQIDQIGERIVVKQIEISNLESQLVNTKQVSTILIRSI